MKIKLNESQLNTLIKESVKKVLNEIGDTQRGQYLLGALAQRKKINGIKNKQYDDESGVNDIFKYANDKQRQNGIDHNPFYNGWHSSKNNRDYGYRHFKERDAVAD